MAVPRRFQLQFGPYKTPRFRYGWLVADEVRGEVEIVGLSEGRIRWPVGRKAGKMRSLIVYGALARAVRMEAPVAVQYWWGVKPSQLNGWRKAMNVPKMNPGTRRLREYNGKADWFKAAQRKAWSKAKDPERCAKIAATKRGKPRPEHVRKALIDANRGRPLSAEHRQKLRDAHRKLATRPSWIKPWTAAEDEFVRTLSIAEAVKATGRTEPAVKSRRRRLGMPDGRRKGIAQRAVYYLGMCSGQYQ